MKLPRFSFATITILFCLGCGPVDIQEQMDDPTTNFGTTYTRRALLEEDFSSMGPWALSSASISGGFVNLTTASASARAALSVPSTGNFEIEFEFNPGANSLALITRSPSPSTSIDEVTVALSQGRILLQRTRPTGALAELRFELGALITGPARITLRHLNGDLVLFVNQQLAGRATVSRFAIDQLELRHAGGPSNITVDGVRVYLLD